MLQPRIVRLVMLYGFVLCTALRADQPADAAAVAAPAQPASPPALPMQTASAAETKAPAPVLETVQSVQLPPPGLCPVITDLLADICAPSSLQGATCSY